MNIIKGRRKSREYAFLLFYRFQLVRNDSKSLQGDEGIKYIEHLRKDATDTLGEVEEGQSSYVSEMVQKYCHHKIELENVITRYLTNWKLERINPIDLTAIYMAYLEIKYLEKPTPVAVAINEYVELAKQYGNEQSAGFVNGILEKLALA